MEIFVVLLFIWLIFIQVKLNELIKIIESNKESKISTAEIPVIEPDLSEKQITSDEISEDSVEDLVLKLENIESPKSKKSFDFETAFLGNIFNKIGAIALIVGVIIFIKLVSPYIVFTPLMKILSGYILGVIIFIFGLRMKEEKLKAYKETLLGTGVSLLFISTYFSSAFFNIFSPVLATMIATIILLSVFFIADKQKTVSMISIALIAGYLNPIIANANASIEFLFGYYIFLNLLSIIYVFKNPKRDVINFVNLCLTFIILMGIFIYRSATISIVYPLVLWVIYLAYDILRKEKSNSEKDKNNILNWLNFAILTLFSLAIFGDKKSEIGYLLTSVSVLYFGLVFKFAKKSSDNYKPYLYSALVTVLLSTLFLTDGVLRVAIWSLEGLILIIVANKYKLDYLLNWAFGFLFSSVTSMLCMDNIVYYKNIDNYEPILNSRTLSFIFPTFLSFVSYFLLNKNKSDKNEKYVELFKFSFVSLIFLYLMLELNSFIYKINFENFDSAFMSKMLLCILGFKYALQTKRMYISSNYYLFNFASYFVAVISCLVLLFAGYKYIPTNSFHPVINVRFLAYLVAIITSAFYAKWTKNEIFKYICVILGFVLIDIEASDFIASSSLDNINWLNTLMWILYAGILTLFGIFKNLKFLKYTGIWISIMTILRIFVYDLKDTDMLYKFIAFLSLGSILLIVSYFYNKKTDKK